MNAPRAAKWMTRELKGLREYAIKRQAEGIVDESRDELAQCDSGERELAMAAGSLEDLANWYGAVGCAAVLDGDGGGFETLDRACLYNFWVIRLLVRGYDLDHRPNKQPRLSMDQIATCWMHAEALGAAAIRAVLDSLVVSVHDGYGGVDGRGMNALVTLVAHYVTGRDAGELERAGWAPIDVYRSVTSGGFTAGNYEALAAYHEQGVEDDEGYPPFYAYPYRVVPFELLAIARRTGVPLAGEHPLLTSPLARPRDVAELAVPDELRGVIARAARDFGIEP